MHVDLAEPRRVLGLEGLVYLDGRGFNLIRGTGLLLPLRLLGRVLKVDLLSVATEPSRDSPTPGSLLSDDDEKSSSMNRFNIGKFSVSPRSG